MEHTFFAVKCLQICLSNKHRNIYYIVCELYFNMNTLWKKIIKYFLEKVTFLLNSLQNVILYSQFINSITFIPLK